MQQQSLALFPKCNTLLRRSLYILYICCSIATSSRTERERDIYTLYSSSSLGSINSSLSFIYPHRFVTDVRCWMMSCALCIAAISLLETILRIRKRRSKYSSRTRTICRNTQAAFLGYIARLLCICSAHKLTPRLLL
jgi:hypothetical protein